jgi:hypothetical protein
MDLFSMNAMMDYIEPKEQRVVYDAPGQFGIVGGPPTMSSIEVMYRVIPNVDMLITWFMSMRAHSYGDSVRLSAVAAYCNAHTPFPGISFSETGVYFKNYQWLTLAEAVSSRAVDCVIATLRWSTERWKAAFAALARGDEFIPLHAPPGLGDLELPPTIPGSEWRFWPIDLAETPEQLAELFRRTPKPGRTFEWNGDLFVHSLAIPEISVYARTEWDRARGLVRTSAVLPVEVAPEVRQSVYDLMARENGLTRGVHLVLRDDVLSIENYQFANGDGTVSVYWINETLNQMEFHIKRLWPELQAALRTPKPLAWQPPERGPMPNEDAPLTVEGMMAALERRAEFLASEAYRKDDLDPARPGVHLWGWDSVVWPEPQERHSLHDGFIAIGAAPPGDTFSVKRQEQPAAVFGHTFDPAFWSPDCLADIPNIREPNAAAQTGALLRALVKLRRPDGRPFFSVLDRAMLGLDPDGAPPEGRPVAPQHLEQHLRWKEHEMLTAGPRGH